MEADTKTKESVAFLLEAGMDVCCGRTRIFKSSSNDYVIIKFNHKSDILMDEEETFTDLNDAVSKFIFWADKKGCKKSDD